jgi:multidrug efflux pump subunit AcrA (membrane-fusion protein)
MNQKFPLAITVILLSAFTLTACGGLGGAAPQVPTAIPPVASDFDIVAEGRMVPRESVQLSFLSSGQVDEVLVKEGDEVKAGQVVARLGNREQMEANIANAETEALAAQQALDKLNEDVTLVKVEAVRALAQANRQVRDAQYQLDNFTTPSNQKKLSALEGVVAMEALLDQARLAFQPYKYYPSEDDTREDLKEKLDQAQSDYNTSIKRLEYETALEEAQSRLDDALVNYQELQLGPDPDALAAAEARLNSTRANLEASKASRKNMDLISTIDGTVVDQSLIAGQTITAGQPVVTVADLSEMFVETDDLTELEVVDISIGQSTLVEPDAIPGLELPGSVDSIGEVFVEKRGDITYTARIRLDDVDPRLRWGMTVLVTFK